jgi:RimJ/RimL family protein N-acetyltransferase
VASWRAAYHHLLPADALRSLSEEERAERWVGILATSPRGTLVAEQQGDGRVLGFVSIGGTRDSDDDPRRTGEVYALHADPEWWGKGVGGRLWSAARQMLLVEEHVEATLWVLEGNARARGFYERVGMTPEESSRRTVRMKGQELPEVRYRTWLT